MIDSVEMTNWRAYDHKRIDFGPGITFVMGANGIGKTTILEAIAYGLTGEPSTAKRPKMLRDQDKLATVRLTFSVDGQRYVVERSQSCRRAERAELVQVSNGRRLASSNRRVTRRIERLMSVSADFLQRIVYMAEGDVFRFLDRPPGEALNLQIRQVLGLTQLDEFVKALEAAEKEIKSRTGSLRRLLGGVEKSGIKHGRDLEWRLRNLDERRERLWVELRAVQERSALYRREHEDLDRLQRLLDGALPAVQKDPSTWQAARQTPVLALFSQLESQFAVEQETAERCRVDLARLEGEQATHKRILDVLSPLSDSTETAPCPVCNKPMTREDRQRVMQDVRNDMNRISDETRNRREHADRSWREADRLRSQVDALRELRNMLAHFRSQRVQGNETIEQLVDVVHSQESSVTVELHEQADKLRCEIDELEREKAEYIVIQRRLQDMGYRAPEDASEALVGMEIRSLSLRAAGNAAHETLAAQRNVDMESIYSQIAHVWEAFIGQDQWRVQLDSQGLPRLQDREGRHFDLTQFSGGEKTALLIMLHTIIAHHFSRSDFLLIDEPLEHLDPVNRRSLIRFLVSAYRRKSFKQAIIATFEESLIRKYMSQEGINVIYL